MLFENALNNSLSYANTHIKGHVMDNAFKLTTGLLASLSFSVLHAADSNYTITPYVDAVYGIFNSQKSYNNPDDQSKKTWQELYAQYGFKGSIALDQTNVYGSLIGVTSATFGDGDAGNNTNGHEHKTNIGEWSIGIKDTSGQEPYSKYNVSIGRQNIIIGDYYSFFDY